MGLVPLNLFAKTNTVEKIASNPPIENDSSVDPQSNRFGLGITLQYAVSERWAVVANPTYRKVKFHAFIQSYSGTDNSSTAVDERLLTQINEDTTARYYDLPLMALVLQEVIATSALPALVLSTEAAPCG